MHMRNKVACMGLMYREIAKLGVQHSAATSRFYFLELSLVLSSVPRHLRRRRLQ